MELESVIEDLKVATPNVSAAGSMWNDSAKKDLEQKLARKGLLLLVRNTLARLL